jgi:hypothetical protein
LDQFIERNEAAVAWPKWNRIDEMQSAASTFYLDQVCAGAVFVTGCSFRIECKWPGSIGKLSERYIKGTFSINDSWNTLSRMKQGSCCGKFFVSHGDVLH